MKVEIKLNGPVLAITPAIGHVITSDDVDKPTGLPNCALSVERAENGDVILDLGACVLWARLKPLDAMKIVNAVAEACGAKQ